MAEPDRGSVAGAGESVSAGCGSTRRDASASDAKSGGAHGPSSGGPAAPAAAAAAAAATQPAAGAAGADTDAPQQIILRRVSELLAAGEWVMCVALLEAELRRRPTEAAATEAMAAVATGRMQELVRALAAAKIHLLDVSYNKSDPSATAVTAATGSSAANGIRSSSGGQAAAAAAVLRWAAVQLSAGGIAGGGAPPAGGGAACGDDPVGTRGAGSQPAGLGGGGAAGGAGGGPLSQREVRSWFRRLATLVHPDKCRTSVVPEAVASSAFRLLQEGCDALLSEDLTGKLDRHGGGGGGGGGACADEVDGAPRKRARGVWCSRSGAGGSDRNYADANGEGEDEEEGEDVWWAEWRACPPSASSHGIGARGGGDARDGGFPTTCPSEGDEEPALWAMGLEDLRAEVAQRQSQVLRPATPGTDTNAGGGSGSGASCSASSAAGLPIHVRQRRLRVARSVLAARTAAAAEPAASPAAAGASHAAGGFPAVGSDGFRGFGDTSGGFLRE